MPHITGCSRTGPARLRIGVQVYPQRAIVALVAAGDAYPTKKSNELVKERETRSGELPLAGLAVGGVEAAPPAVLLELDALAGVVPVLLGYVVPALALGALERHVDAAVAGQALTSSHRWSATSIARAVTGGPRLPSSSKAALDDVTRVGSAAISARPAVHHVVAFDAVPGPHGGHRSGWT